MRQLIGRKFMRDKELQYYILGGGKKGYMVEICEITHIRKVEALLPGGFAFPTERADSSSLFRLALSARLPRFS